MAKQLDGRSSIERRKKGFLHPPSVWSGALSIFLLLLIIAVRLLGDRLYDYPVNPEPQLLPKDSLIVCLAGGKFRVEAAYDLFANGIGKELLIVGAGKRTSALGLARAHASESMQRISSERFGKIQVETESKNTIENAFVVTKFLQQKPQVKNLILITSGYHMRRAQVMIEHQSQGTVNIIPYTPPSEAIDRKNWWHSWLGIQVTVVEYFKFLMTSWIVPHLTNS